MFFIMGIDPRKKLLTYNKVFICDHCGQYGRYEVWLSYMCFSLFFIPLIKWNKHFYVRTTCCGTTYELDPAIGRAIANGSEVEIRPEHLMKIQGQSYQRGKTCSRCGFTTNEDFPYCPNCGNKF